MREPRIFRGESFKDARRFLRELELIYEWESSTFRGDREKVLYGLRFLDGEVQERWYDRHTLAEVRTGYSYEKFKAFVRDFDGNYVNREPYLGFDYQHARQRAGQSAQNFAMELETLEDELGSGYTERQKASHFLASLPPAMRTVLSIFEDTASCSRQELVTMAMKIETADKTSYNNPAVDPHLQSQSHQTKKRKQDSHSTLAQRIVGKGIKAEDSSLG